MKTILRFRPAALVPIAALIAASAARADLEITTSALPAATEETAFSTLLQASGGTEPYSWAVKTVYAESSESSTFAETGTAQNWHADDSAWDLVLPFSFPFFGATYTTARISSNGWIAFGETVSSYFDPETPSIAVLAGDLRTDVDDCDVFVESDQSAVTIRWKAVYYDLQDSFVNVAATLRPDGTIALSYGSGNGEGGTIAVSEGAVGTNIVSALSQWGPMGSADDIVFSPVSPLPAGVSLSSGGTLAGTPAEPGEYPFTAIVTDDDGSTASADFVLSVAENPALRPSIEFVSPDEGDVDVSGLLFVSFSVTAVHPDGGALAYAWTVDGEPAGTESSFELDLLDGAVHDIVCTVSGAGLSKTASAEWKTWIPLRIDTDAELSGTMTGVSLWEYLSASGGVPPYTWSVGNDWPYEVADGWYVEAYGEIEIYAEDDEAGTYELPVRVTDAAGNVAEKTFTVVVAENPNHAPVFTLLDPKRENVYVAPGSSISFEAVAVDPDGDELGRYWQWCDQSDWDWSYDYDAGSTFSLSDLPEGNYEVRTEVYDTPEDDGWRHIYHTWYVHVGDYLVIDTEELSEAPVGLPYEATLSAHRTIGETGTLTWYTWNLPEGLSLSEAGVLSGTPTEPGDYSFQINVNSSVGPSGWSNFELHVDSGAPRFSDVSPARGPVNLAGVASQPFSVTASSSIGAALSYEWLLDGEPVGTDASSYAYAHEASDASMHTLRCVVTAAGVDEEAEAEWTLGVLSATDPADVTVAEGGTAVLSVQVSSSAPATVEWIRDGTGAVVGRGPVLRLVDVRRGASYHAVVTSLFGSVETASATVTVTPRPAGNCTLVVSEVAAARAGRSIEQLSAYGTHVVWAETDWDGNWMDENGNWKTGDDIRWSLREWDGGFLGDVVSDDETYCGSGWPIIEYRPLVTADGLYYVTGLEDLSGSWFGREEFRYQPVGGETVVARTGRIGTMAGENWDIFETESGRVVATHYRFGQGNMWNNWPIYDVTGGTMEFVRTTDWIWTFSEDTGEWIPDPDPDDWSASYIVDKPVFLPTATGWNRGKPDGSLSLAVLRDGETEPLYLDGVGGLDDDSWVWSFEGQAELRGASANALLWEECRDDHVRALVLADGQGENRIDLATMRGTFLGTVTNIQEYSGWTWTNVQENAWSEPAFASFLSGGVVCFERATEGGGKELVVRLADGTTTVLDSVASAGDAPDSAKVFHAVAYRGGVAWASPTGGLDAGEAADLRVWLGGGADASFSLGGIVRGDGFSVRGCGTRLAYERVSGGTRRLCVWEGSSDSHTEAVLASGYDPDSGVRASVNAAGAAAAVNMGSAAAPDWRVYAAFDPAATPVVADLPGGTELVPCSADVADELGVADCTWTLLRGAGRGFDLDEDGTLSGTVAEAGTYTFKAVSTDGDGAETLRTLRLAIAPNPNRPPVIDAVTPAPGGANFGAETQLVFSVTAHDPEDGALVYRWFVDEEEQAETGASFMLVRETGDVSAHNVRCVVEDDLWTEETAGPAVRSVEWNAGVLAIVSAEAPSVHTGQKPRLSVVLESTVEFYGSDGMPPGFNATTWYDAATDEEIAVGNTVLAPADGSGTYYAVTETQFGSVRTENLTVSIDPAPLAGRIYKRSGAPALVGNRCVLHAGAWGEGDLSFSWTRDGTEVSTARTLDIAALSKEDFGTYVFTVRSEAGEDSSPPFRLAPAPSGTVVGWTHDGYDTDGILPPSEINDAVQVAASSYGGVALRRNGTIAAWSENSDENGLADVPTGLAGVQQVAARRDWSSKNGTMAALKRDGSVLLWGHDDDDFPFDVSLELGDVVRIALMCDSLVVLRANGTVARTFFDWYDDGNGWDRHLLLEEEEGVSDAVGVFCGPDEYSILHEDGTLSGDCTADGAADLVSVGGRMDSWSWIAVTAGGNIRAPTWPNWDKETAESLVGAISADEQNSSSRAVILTEDGVIHDIVYDGEETPAGGTRAFAVACGARHTLAIVADTDVDVADADLLDVLENAGLVEDAGAASEMELVRAASADFDGDGQTAWAEYVAGTDPTDETKVFRADIAFENGLPIVTWDPDLGAARDYAIETADENGGAWTETTADEIAADGAEVKFFRVKVALPDPNGN